MIFDMMQVDCMFVFDLVENNVYFLLLYLLLQYMLLKIDFDGVDYLNLYIGGKWKVLMIVIDECYILMMNGKMFLIGNYLVEMLLLMYYMDKVGFEIDIVMLLGNLVKFEFWVMLQDDEVVQSIYWKYLLKLKMLFKLFDVFDWYFGVDLLYIVVFIFGGYGVFVGILYSKDVKCMLCWVFDYDWYIIMLCYGFVCLLLVVVDEDFQDYLFKDYEICVFLDVFDMGLNFDIGYMLGLLLWFVV